MREWRQAIPQLFGSAAEGQDGVPPALQGLTVAVNCAPGNAKGLGDLVGGLARLGQPPGFPKHPGIGIRRGKNDAVDAAAICEAVTRPSMRFVAIKTEAQQAALMLHKSRALLVRQQTMLVNAMRAHMAELGLIAPQGRARINDLIAVTADRDNSHIPLRGVDQRREAVWSGRAVARRRIAGHPCRATRRPDDDAQILDLSTETLIKIRAGHREVDAAAWRALRDPVDGGEAVLQQTGLVFHGARDGDPWSAVAKATEDGRELDAATYHRSNAKRRARARRRGNVIRGEE